MYMQQIIERSKAERLSQAKERMKQYDHVLAIAISAKLMHQSCTLDDEISARRWVFNKHGELIYSRTFAGVIAHSKHDWQPGVRDRVDVA